MDNQGLAKVAYELVEKQAKDFYSDKSMKQRFVPTMSKEDAATELEWLHTPEGQKYYDKQDKYNRYANMAVNHLMVTAPVTIAGMADGMRRGNAYGKGPQGTLLGGALYGIPTALAVQGSTMGLDALGRKVLGTPYDNRKQIVQKRYDKLVAKENKQ